MWTMHEPVHVRSLVFSLVFVYLPLPFCLSSYTITLDKPISDLAGETLVSDNSFFELGFFTPNGSSSARRYVGIWYYGYYPLTVVWVANRDKALSTNTGFFGLAEDGNLAVWTSSQQIWSSSLKDEVSFNRTIRLTDTGNLVLSEVGGSQLLWQSFENPAHTFIPGMVWSEEFKLTSWIAVDDPTVGNFTFQVDPDRANQYMIQKKDTPLPYWMSGLYGKLQSTNSMITVISCLLSDSSCSQPSNPNYKLSRLYNINYNHSRLVMDWAGEIQFYTRINDSAPWSLYGYQPRDVCSIFKYCGNYGSCSNENIVPCKCLPGFEPTSPEQWSTGEFSAGCTRKSALCDIDEFMSLKKMKAGSPQEIEADSEAKCKKICLNSCDCQAYYYLMASPSREGLGSSSTCWTWSSDLNNILEQAEDGYNLNVRIASTDIDPMKRSCKFCGTNVVPYPLSTGESCGDPLYSRFSCDNETSQLYFSSYDVLYRVTYIIPEVKKFAISMDDNKTSCTSKDLLNKTLQLDHSLHFYLIRGCNSSKNFILNSFSQDQVLYEVEIGWSTPPTPSCASDSDCADWPSTTCNAIGDGKKICHCNANPSWNPSSNCLPAKNSAPTGRSSSDKKPLYLIPLVAIAILILFVGLFYYRRRGLENENAEAVQENLALRLHDSEQRIKEWISSSQFQEEDKKSIDVPFFDLKIILAATHNFSNENKLGQGGFGPVYKGTFPGGQEIAIKRLSSASGQGLEEFKNEVVLIAKLQHRNLVRLLGYCIEGEEKLLLYEYMLNGSLDSFIFDRTRCLLLTWELRFEIILGIARGMLYLHQDSRLRIIHRDLKSSNILLDEEMNPKISDFGLARIFESNQTEATTKRVIGTYGYMSPEYVLDGSFSFKSDVFSFGVVILEIVSGKRNTGLYQRMGILNLISHAWKLWSENNALNLMDHALHETSNTSEVLKCINIALLCVQEDPGDRPIMSMVLFMLGSEGATLPAPKRPGIAVNRSQSTTTSSSKPETIYDMSITAIEGR